MGMRVACASSLVAHPHRAAMLQSGYVLHATLFSISKPTPQIGRSSLHCSLAPNPNPCPNQINGPPESMPHLNPRPNKATTLLFSAHVFTAPNPSTSSPHCHCPQSQTQPPNRRNPLLLSAHNLTAPDPSTKSYGKFSSLEVCTTVPSTRKPLRATKTHAQAWI